MASRPRRDEPRQGEAPTQQPQSPPKQNGGEATPPVYSRRYWTGAGNLEIAVFARQVDSGGSNFTAYSTSLKRSYKDDSGEYKETRYLRTEDLLVAAHALTEAFAWITSEQQKG